MADQDDEDFSNEALFRLLQDMDGRHGAELREIRKQTTETNGRVRGLESDVKTHAREIGRLNSAVFPRRTFDQSTPPALPSPDESLSVRMSPKVWTALAAAGGVLFAMLVESIKKWLAQP